MKKFAAIALSAGIALGAAGMSMPNLSAKAAFSYRNYANTYQMQTGIAMPPSIAFEITCKYDIEALATEKTPTVALIRADKNGNAVDLSGNAIAPLDEAVRACNNKTVPAFVIEDEAAKESVLNYVTEKGLPDIMVFSSDPALVKSFKETRANVQGGIFFKNVDWTKENAAAEVKNTLNENSAMIAVVESDTPKEIVEEIQFFGLTCWSFVKGVEYDIYNALYSGVNGMVVKNFTMPIEIIESFTEPTMLRKTFMSGHRGENTYPENTFVSAQFAYYQGVDYIELDLMRTKDDHLIVMHDKTLNRTCNYEGDKLISEMTLEEVQQYKVQLSDSAPTYDIPTLDEYFGFVKAHGEDLKLLVELKTNDMEVVPLLVDAVKEYDVADNIIVISSFYDCLSAFKKAMPHVTTGGLESFKTLSGAANFCYQYNSSFGPGYTYLEKDSATGVMEQAIARGIPVYSWTYAAVDKFEHYMYRNTSLTTDVATYAKEQVIKLTTTAESAYEITENTQVDVAGTITNRARTTPLQAPRVTKTATLTMRNAPVISSALKPVGQVASFTDGKLSLETEGYGIVLLSHKWESAFSDNTYDVYAQPVKVVYNANASDYETEVLQADYDPNKNAQGGEDENSSGCKNTVSLGGLALIATALGVGFAFTRKKNEN